MTARGAKIVEREPDYVTSMILQKPIEMIEARKIAYLVLLQRGWLAKYAYFEAPERFATWRTAFKRNATGYRPLPILRCWNPSQALSHWRRLGIVKTIEVVGCRIVRRYVLTKKGEQLLEHIAPEMLAEARAIVRAAIWTHVVLARRRALRQKAQFEQMAIQAMPIPANPKAKIRAGASNGR